MNLANVNLNLLVAFNALLKEQHVTRAGQSLHITQSAMSNLLKQLREVFQDELFIRGQASRMIPTPRALQLKQPIAELLEKAAYIFEKPAKFNPMMDKHTFTLGMSDYAEFIILPLLIQSIERLAPAVDIVVKHVNFIKNEFMFVNDEVDLAIGIYSDIPENLIAENIFKEESVCLGWKENALLKKPLTLESFAAAKQIMILYHEKRIELFSEQYLKQHHLERRIMATVPRTLAAIYSLPNTQLIITVLKRIAKIMTKNLPLKMQPVPFPYPDINIHMVWHPKNRNNSAQQWLNQQIRSITKKI